MSDLSKRLHEKHGKHNWHRCHCECVEHLAAAEIEALEARVAELERDRERLDWLEADGVEVFGQRANNLTLREAIDKHLSRERIADADAENYCMCGEAMISHSAKTGHAAVSVADHLRARTAAALEEKCD